MLVVKNLSVYYQGNAIITDLDLKVDFPSVIGVLGNNGSGKSTFLNALRGNVDYRGNVFINQQKVNPLDAYHDFSYLGQSYQFNFSFTVRDFILINHPALSDYELFNLLVDNLEIEELLEKDVTKISQGQLQKSLIAQTLMQESKVVLLDEPEVFLDIKNRGLLAVTLMKYQTLKNKIILMVSHDLDLVREVSNQIINFSDVGIVLDTTSEDNINKHKTLLLQ